MPILFYLSRSSISESRDISDVTGGVQKMKLFYLIIVSQAVAVSYRTLH